MGVVAQACNHSNLRPLWTTSYSFNKTKNQDVKDGSVGKELADQSWRPEFDPQKLPKVEERTDLHMCATACTLPHIFSQSN